MGIMKTYGQFYRRQRIKHFCLTAYMMTEDEEYLDIKKMEELIAM